MGEGAEEGGREGSKDGALRIPNASEIFGDFRAVASDAVVAL